MISFTKYAKIKDFYCLCYYGNSDEYLLQLLLIKPFLENRFSGIKIRIGCKDDKKNMLFANNELFLSQSSIVSERLNFGYVREIRFNGKIHPIEEIIKECNIDNFTVVSDLQKDYNNKCVIITKGNYPTVSLEQDKIKILKSIGSQEGFECFLDDDVSDAGLVMGVESWGLFEAASRGVRTKLWPTGLGTWLYKTMFPRGEIIKI